MEMLFQKKQIHSFLPNILTSSKLSRFAITVTTLGINGLTKGCKGKNIKKLKQLLKINVNHTSLIQPTK